MPAGRHGATKKKCCPGCRPAAALSRITAAARELAVFLDLARGLTVMAQTYCE